jgi:hypothetical protein
MVPRVVRPINSIYIDIEYYTFLFKNYAATQKCSRFSRLNDYNIDMIEFFDTNNMESNSKSPRFHRNYLEKEGKIVDTFTGDYVLDYVPEPRTKEKMKLIQTGNGEILVVDSETNMEISNQNIDRVIESINGNSATIQNLNLQNSEISFNDAENTLYNNNPDVAVKRYEITFSLCSWIFVVCLILTILSTALLTPISSMFLLGIETESATRS